MAKVTITAYDDDGTELTTTIEIEMGDAPQAIELWQSVRTYADKQALKITRETAIVNLMKAFNISRITAVRKLDKMYDPTKH